MHIKKKVWKKNVVEEANQGVYISSALDEYMRSF